MVITDGRSNGGVSSLRKPADDLKKNHVNIFAVGAGNNVNSHELNAIASSSDHVMRISSINALQGILGKLQSAVCKGTVFAILVTLLLKNTAESL